MSRIGRKPIPVPAGVTIAIEPELVTVSGPKGELAERIQQVTLAAFRAVGGRGYGRVDIRLDEQNQPCVLEVNCNPCLDEGMALARSAERAGISYPRLLHLILMFALEPQPFDPQVPMMPPETRRRVRPNRSSTFSTTSRTLTPPRPAPCASV